MGTRHVLSKCHSDLALFDFDGTLTERETFPLFVRAVTPRLRATACSFALLPLIAGCRLGWIGGTVTRAGIVRVALRGLPAEAVAAAGERFAEAVEPTLLRPQAWARLQRHRDRGDAVAIVPGALDAYLAPWCRAQGLTLFCSSLEQRDGRSTGRYRGAQSVGAEKARCVRAHYDFGRFADVHAYGDTPEDRELMALAAHRHYRGKALGRARPRQRAESG
ncbi:HAD-IB family phosphatase [Tahibacter caeni]|uniref:HAD-IB family phosphatase n=1 Tax=Tahibacter caeni TaxID=1453545 RepID=UPI0021487FDE|nr:HAD-IB family phosphatase [Tahibacter caeni]